MFDADAATRHAVQTQHADFEEYVPSADDPKPEAEPQGPTLSPEEKQQKLAEVQAKIKERKDSEAIVKEKEALDKERDRRERAKLDAEATQKFKEMKALKVIEEQKREKEADKAYHEKLKKQIEEERLARLNKTSGAASAASTPQPAPVEAPVTTPSPSVSSHTECVLQIRLTNGNKLQHTFKATETIGDVIDYISKNRTDGSGAFEISTPMPRKVLGDRSVTLSAAELVPRGVVVVAKK
jgi:hypothetical protein